MVTGAETAAAGAAGTEGLRPPRFAATLTNRYKRRVNTRCGSSLVRGWESVSSITYGESKMPRMTLVVAALAAALATPAFAKTPATTATPDKDAAVKTDATSTPAQKPAKKPTASKKTTKPEAHAKTAPGTKPEKPAAEAPAAK